MTQIIQRHDAANSDPAVITCAACAACCCKLQVSLMSGDDVPEHLTEDDERNTTVMRRESDGWCAALNRDTLRCTIYARRPLICREFAMGGNDCVDARM